MTLDDAWGASHSPREVDEVSRLGELARSIAPQPVLFDPKGDQELIEAIQYLARGQKAYGEWLKKLSANDRAPRGKCGRYFATHTRFRRSV